MFVGKQKDIQEVKNTYEQIDKVNPYSVDNLKKIHKISTFLIEKNAGKFRLVESDKIDMFENNKSTNKKYIIKE